MNERGDKRRYHRFMAMLEVRVLPGEPIPSDLILSTIDIAVGGALCAANLPVPEDTRMQMTFKLVGGELPTPESIDVDARVLRCEENPQALPNRRYELAIEFVRIDPQDRRRLQTYLNGL